jgi:hypothetical protein
MSPELERLLTALYERDTSEPNERAKWEMTVHHIVSEALAKLPFASRTS